MKNRRNLYTDRKGRLIASIRVNGRQRLKRVKSEEQAREWFLLMETESTQASQLTFKELNDAAEAFTILRQHQITISLSEVVGSWLGGRGNAPQGPTRTFNEAIAEYLERSKTRVTPGTLKDYRLMLVKFKDLIGGHNMVAAFKKPDAIKFLDRFLDRPPTWGAYQRTLSRFFTECVRMEWTTSNPFTGLDAPKCKPPERKFLSVEDTKAALNSVVKRQPRLIHFLTLGLFAGIRPIESLRLTKEHVNLDTGYICLTGDVVKSHSFKERVVPINDTLRAWLTRYPFEEKPIPVNDICYVDKIIKECSEQDGWPRTQDNLRHSFATYQFALTGNSAETASMCGHAEAIAMKHYRGRVTKEQAQSYFSIVP